jgi:uncharacterized RDD family membrane protein YckC
MNEENLAPEPPAEPPPADRSPPAEPQPPPVQWAVPPPVAEVPGAPGLAFADIPARLVAYSVDAAIVGLVGSVAAISLGFGERAVTATSSYVWVSGTTFSISFALVGLVYFVFFWTGGRRATIGQRIFDIQVGNAFDGRPLSLDQALGRWAGYGSFIGLVAIVRDLDRVASLAQLIWVLLLFVTTARSPTKQGLHDRFANTALVRPSSRTSSGPAMACLIILVLLSVLFAIAVAALILLGSQVGPLLKPPGGTI